jgi:light-regulated signal transduction histidine kinase (bacteriophytochrome)
MLASGLSKTETVDLKQKVQRVLEDLEPDVKERRAVIQVENLPTIKGYERQLQQLFQNPDWQFIEI